MNNDNPELERYLEPLRQRDWKRLDQQVTVISTALLDAIDGLGRLGIDKRVSLAVARAITAKLYQSLSAAEQNLSDDLSRELMRKLNVMVIPNAAIIPGKIQVQKH